MGFLGDWFDAGGLVPMLFDKDDDASRLEGFQFPDFKEDPDYRATQDYLKDLGIDILGGDIPDYYKGIGEAGGAEFEKYMSLMTGDIQRSALETSAALGRGGGRATEVAAEQVGEFSTKSRYADYLRSLEGKEWLFGQGRGITEGVRGAGQTQSSQENIFAQNKATQEFGLEKYLEGYDINQDAMQGEMIGNLLNLGLTAGGFALGGPTGAYVGSSIGSALGGGGIDLDAIFGAMDKETKTTGTSAKNRIDIGKIKPIDINKPYQSLSSYIQ